MAKFTNLLEIEELREEIEELNWAISRADDRADMLRPDKEGREAMEIKRNRLMRRLTELNKANGFDY
ncbi:hypothetical protein [Staphylococcus shinii]|uniref:hypothetical protein n=1 Tax=Staphylococcus shinii TaxID=2912228 RepID=UPI002971680F|nr:hypothetical protein [Staphylococcus saprophyticus]